MRRQVFTGDKSRPLAYDVECVMSPHTARFSFMQPKNPGCRWQNRRSTPFDAHYATMIHPNEYLFPLLSKHRNVSEIYHQILQVFCTYLSDLWLMHLSCTEYFVEVFGRSVGRRHTPMTSSKYGVCSLDLGCAD